MKSGMLLCSSGMGLTVLDLFNDIFIDQNDIRFFIEQHGLTPSTSSSGTIIQAYLIFCHMAAENNNMPIFDLIKRNQLEPNCYNDLHIIKDPNILNNSKSLAPPTC